MIKACVWKAVTLSFSCSQLITLNILKLLCRGQLVPMPLSPRQRFQSVLNLLFNYHDWFQKLFLIYSILNHINGEDACLCLFGSVGRQSTVYIATFMICSKKSQSNCAITAYSFSLLPFVSQDFSAIYSRWKPWTADFITCF